MIYIKSPSTDPHFNLALEQYVFDEMDRSQEYFMLWQNDNAIIIGKHQNTVREINSTYVKEHGISVVRRLSGGGAVYHDLGNLNFTFIVSENGLEQFDFGSFCRPIVKALGHFGVKAEINGRNDMTIDGKSFPVTLSMQSRGGLCTTEPYYMTATLKLFLMHCRFPQTKSYLKAYSLSAVV